MRPVSSGIATPPPSTAPTTRAKGGPAVRGQARAAEVHALKAQGLSPSRKDWREAAATTPAVVVTISPEATAALAAAPSVLPTEPTEPADPGALLAGAAPTSATFANAGTYLDVMVG